MSPSTDKYMVAPMVAPGNNESHTHQLRTSQTPPPPTIAIAAPTHKRGQPFVRKRGRRSSAKTLNHQRHSGGVKNGDDLEGHPAILDLPAGKGRVVAFNFNPMHRDLNHSDYRFLWNVLLNWRHLLQRP